MRHLPFGIAGDRHGLPLALLVLAPQRGLRCMSDLLCMGLILRLGVTPTSRRVRHGPDDRLTALMDVDVLDRDLLLPLSPVSIQGL